MAESLKANASINNTTQWDMNLQDHSVSWGKWVHDPPQTISAGDSGSFEAEGDDFTPTGTEGSVTYSLVNNPQNATVTMTFNVPAAGDDSVGISCNPADALNVSALQSRGDNDQITYKVGPPITPDPGPIKNVFVLMLENRAFDHMLGFSGITGTDAQLGTPTQIDGLAGTESNTYNQVSYQVSQPADYVMPAGPGHEFTDVLEQLGGVGANYPSGGPYPTINNGGFAADYVVNGGGSNPGEIMKCYTTSTQLPVLYTLAQEFAVCDHWYASMPGPTWPNRFFAAAASSGGLDHSPTTEEIAEWESIDGFSFENGTIFDQLGKLPSGWRIYRGDDFPITGALKGITITDTISYDNFASDLQGTYPWAFTFIEPNYGDFENNTYTGGTSQHPVDDVTSGEGLIKSVYETIRASTVWPNSLLIVTWDEHGGFYDHEAPPGAVAPGDTITASNPPFSIPINEYGFNFEQYGVRVPAVVVSAYTPKNLIDHRPYDHASIPATLEVIFGLPSLTNRDAQANNVTALVSLPTARTDTPTTLPDPANSGSSAATMAAAAEAAAATRPALSINEGNLPGFIHVAMRSDLALSPPAERPAIVARVKAIKTREEAAQYIKEVRQKIRTADAAR